jgi:hypothetical protein
VSTIGLGKGGGGFSGQKTVTTNQVTTRALDNQSVPNPVSTCNADLGALVDAKQYGKAQKGGRSLHRPYRPRGVSGRVAARLPIERAALEGRQRLQQAVLSRHCLLPRREMTPDSCAAAER